MDDALYALMTEMVGAGQIPHETVLAAADRCEREGNARAAHHLRCLLVEASMTTPAEWEAQRRRAGMRLVPDGGNDA